MEWLFAHMEDPGWFFPRLAARPLILIGLLVDIDTPIIQTASGGGGGGSSGPEPSSERIAMLAEMGFSPQQARKALRQTVRGARSRSPLLPSLTSRTRDVKHAICRTEIRSVQSNGCSRIRMTRARKTKEEEHQQQEQHQQLRRSLDLPRCLRVTASGPSSRTKARPSTLATMSPTSAPVTLGSSSTTRRSSGLMRTASARSSPWRTCTCLRGRGLEKKKGVRGRKNAAAVTQKLEM